MLRHLLLVSLLITSAAVSGQKMSVERGDEFTSSLYYQGHLLSDETGHYLYFYKPWIGTADLEKATLYFGRFGSDFREDFAKAFPTSEGYGYTLSMKVIGGRFVWASKEHDGKIVHLRLSVLSRDAEVEQTVKLSTLTHPRYGGIPDVRWLLSQDSSVMLVAAFIDADEKKENFNIAINVLDRDLNKMWKNQFTLPQSEEEISLESITVDNKGRVYALVKIYKDGNKEFRGNAPNYELAVLQFEEGRSAPRKIDLGLNSLFFKGGEVQMMPNGDLAVACFISNNPDTLIQGSYLARIDPDEGKMLLSNKTDYTSNILDMFGKENIQKKSTGPGLHEHFKYKEMFALPNGNTIIIAERDYIYRPSGTDGGRNSYNSGDIAAIFHDARGTLLRVVIIPKWQRRTMDYAHTGYCLVKRDGKFWFFFNDNKKNLDTPIGTEKAAPMDYSANSTIVTGICMDEEGNLERISLPEIVTNKNPIMTRYAQDMNGTGLFFATRRYHYFDKQYSLGRAVFTE